MRKYDFTASETFIAGAPISVLQRFGLELSRGWPVFANVFQALEEDGLPGEEANYLMEGVVIVWHATIKTTRRKLPKITIEDIERHMKEFADFLAYHGKADLEEQQSLHYIQYPQLEAFTLTQLRETYGGLERVPSHVTMVYFAVMKCFDKVIARDSRQPSTR